MLRELKRQMCRSALPSTSHVTSQSQHDVINNRGKKCNFTLSRYLISLSFFILERGLQTKEAQDVPYERQAKGIPVPICYWRYEIVGERHGAICMHINMGGFMCTKCNSLYFHIQQKCLLQRQCYRIFTAWRQAPLPSTLWRGVCAP
jgi:hypothetical protein